MTKSSKLFMSTDPGVDDLLTHLMLIQAVQQKKFELLGVLGHYGCTSVANVIEHVHRAYRCLGPDFPIIMGSAEPEKPHLYGLPTYYGENGLCDEQLPEVEGQPWLSGDSPEDRVAEVIAAASKSRKESRRSVEFVEIGPATDLAKFFRKHHELAAHSLSALTIMAGAFGQKGNCGAQRLAEFNVYCDVPAFVESLEFAKRHRIPVNLISWDYPVLFFESDLRRFYPATPAAELTVRLLKAYFRVHGNEDVIPGDRFLQPLDLLQADTGEKERVWRATDPKVWLFLSRPELFECWKEKIWVVTDARSNDHFGQTLNAAQLASIPQDLHKAGPFAVQRYELLNPQFAQRVLMKDLGFVLA